MLRCHNGTVSVWPAMAVPSEVLTAFKEKRHEIHLSGPEISKCIAERNNDLPDEVYKLTLLNFLEVSGTSLNRVSESFEKFSKFLTNLALFGNQIETVSPIIGSLSKLKYLDLSNNKIQSLPDELHKLTQLQTLNVSQNQLSALPDLSGSYLVSVNASYNSFEQLPSWLCNQELEHLSELDFSHNQVKEIPAGLAVLPAMKRLNLESNQVYLVPGELADAPKLKELLLKDNKLKDNRLRKLVEGKPKSVMEYVKKNCPKNTQKSQQKETAEKVPESGDSEVSGEKKDTVIVLPAEKQLMITVMNALNKIRPYLVCCILRNVDLREEKMKKFITIQNKLHDGICKKRVAATIATHDLKMVHSPLVFAARTPDEILMRPLNRKKDVSAREYVDLLKDEAEKRRKELKRTSYSGVHQYLSLLRPWQRYPCFIDGSGTVISFPPITNSDVTRISAETQDILVEVTSSEGLAICKEVMDQLIAETLKAGLGNLRARPIVSESDFPTLPNAKPQADNMTHILSALSLSEEAIDNVLIIEQCRVLAEDESLKVAYPAKPDLAGLGDGVEVRRKL